MVQLVSSALNQSPGLKPSMISTDVKFLIVFLISLFKPRKKTKFARLHMTKRKILYTVRLCDSLIVHYQTLFEYKIETYEQS